MSSSSYEGGSPSSGRKYPNRHSDHQTQRLEAYFNINQHPNERVRCQLGREVGLTPDQIKFWFQNKRTLSKAQSDQLEGNALRQENERMKSENLAMIEALKDGLCMPCKGLSTNPQTSAHLNTENEQLKVKYERLANVLSLSGIPVPEPILLSQASSGSVPPLSSNESNPNMPCDQPTWEQKPNPTPELDIPRIVQVVTKAVEELTRLLTVESFWSKDQIDGRYVLHRNNYETAFLGNSHLRTSPTRVESSKEEGVVRMRGLQLLTMLQNSSTRLDLFPTIITKAITMQQLQAGISSLKGALKLVQEQIHILSPLVAPREFDLIRYSEQVGKGSWIIVDVSHSLSYVDKSQTSPFRSWRFPSGCLIKDLGNGFSKITWVEHVEVDDKASTHPIYRDVIFGGSGYGARRYIFTLQKMCERFATQLGETSMSEEVEAITDPEGRRNIMNLTHRMVKNLFANLSMKRKMDIPQEDTSETRVNVYNNTEPGLPRGMIINATTSLWIPMSFQDAFSFFKNARNRYQWDAFSNGDQLQEIASITYGNDLGNRISIIQSLVPGDTDTLLVQESSIDLQGGVIVYAAIHKGLVEMVVNGEDSSNIPILASGFIISSDGHTAGRATRDEAASTSSSSTAPQNGSLLTVTLQIMQAEGSTSEQISAHINSTMQKIKLSVDSSNSQ